jgi:hypothetical protein
VLIQETLAVKKLDSVCITILFTLGTTEKISALAPPPPYSCYTFKYYILFAKNTCLYMIFLQADDEESKVEVIKRSLSLYKRYELMWIPMFLL